MAHSSNGPRVPMLISYDFIHRVQTPAEIAAHDMYDWEMTSEGYLRKDKTQSSMSSETNSTTMSDVASEQSSDDFKGPCYDETDGKWSQSFEFDSEGKIDDLDNRYFHNVKDAHHGRSVEIPKALELVAATCHATGSIYLNECNGDHVSSDECTDFRAVIMSGFYLPHGYFLTSAHFTVCGRGEQAMKTEGSDRARVNTTMKPAENFDYAPNKAQLVHLVYRDIDLDFALFCLDKNQQFPKFCVPLDRLLCMVDLDFHADLANRRAFTIGYNQRYNKAKYPQAVKKTIAALSPQKQQQLKEISPSLKADFNDMFCPGHKSLTIGRLNDQPPDEGSTSWSHRISGWHGISGAMIACMDMPPGGEPRIRILGIFKGGLEGNHNMMVPFTAVIINKIREVVGMEEAAVSVVPSVFDFVVESGVEGREKGKWYNKGKGMRDGLRRSLRIAGRKH